MVIQPYDVDVNKEYVIKGNAAIFKCQIPSYVADFVTVVSWHTDSEETYYYPSNYAGIYRMCLNGQKINKKNNDKVFRNIDFFFRLLRGAKKIFFTFPNHQHVDSEIPFAVKCARSSE